MWCIDREVKNVGIVEGKKNILEHEIWIFTKVKKREEGVSCMWRNECPLVVGERGDGNRVLGFGLFFKHYYVAVCLLSPF